MHRTLDSQRKQVDAPKRTWVSTGGTAHQPRSSLVSVSTSSHLRKLIIRLFQIRLHWATCLAVHRYAATLVQGHVGSLVHLGQGGLSLEIVFLGCIVIQFVATIAGPAQRRQRPAQSSTG